MLPSARPGSEENIAHARHLSTRQSTFARVACSFRAEEGLACAQTWKRRDVCAQAEGGTAGSQIPIDLHQSGGGGRLPYITYKGYPFCQIRQNSTVGKLSVYFNQCFKRHSLSSAESYRERKTVRPWRRNIASWNIDLNIAFLSCFAD